jgi:hypothetical protein
VWPCSAQRWAEKPAPEWQAAPERRVLEQSSRELLALQAPVRRVQVLLVLLVLLVQVGPVPAWSVLVPQAPAFAPAQSSARARPRLRGLIEG